MVFGLALSLTAAASVAVWLRTAEWPRSEGTHESDGTYDTDETDGMESTGAETGRPDAAISNVPSASPPTALSTPSPTRPTRAMRILAGAKREVSAKTRYLETYDVLAYPGGDVAPDIGVCTDLVIRAYRNAGIDLQRDLHEDRKSNSRAYPTELWDYKKPDRNIDHRRCQNLCVFFERHARELPRDFTGENRGEWRVGDVVFFVRPGKEFPWHVAIVSDRSAPDESPMILHLFPPRASEAPISPYLPIHSHYRWNEEQP